MRWRLFLLLMLPATFALAADTPDARLLIGADVSALPSLEQMGAVYRDAGRPGDAIAILRAHGVNLFRVRLFVHPNSSFARSGGAVQDLPYVLALARRIKASGAGFLLDLHYADTWADPGHQPTPAAWRQLDRPHMEAMVHDYTQQVLQACDAADVRPDWVQIGNEITAGILWPTGQLGKSKGEAEDAQWQELSRLLNAGCRAVREASAVATANPRKPIRIILHVDRGGRQAPVWFFDQLSRTPVDFDVIGLSFYPAWGDALPVLQQNMQQLISRYQKDVLICETGYPWKPLAGVKQATMAWPQTPAGQQQFLQDLCRTLRAAPEHRGIGYVWWYPEAVPIGGHSMWRGGAEAWFDSSGNLLPAAQALGKL